jgi:hypothetical protein
MQSRDRTPHCPVWVGTRDHRVTHIPYLTLYAQPTLTNPTPHTNNTRFGSNMVISVVYTSTGVHMQSRDRTPHCPVWVGTRDHLVTNIPCLALYAQPTLTNPTPTTRVLGATWSFQWCGGGRALPPRTHPRSGSGCTHAVRSHAACGQLLPHRGWGRSASACNPPPQHR